MSTFNTYNWSKHKVSKRDQIPSGPHYQALVFGTRSEWTPPYDARDGSGSSYSVENVDVYVFTKRDEFELFVSEAAKSSVSFVFYAVNGLGKATVKVEVDAALPEEWLGVDGEGNPMQGFGHGRGGR